MKSFYQTSRTIDNISVFGAHIYIIIYRIPNECFIAINT